METRWKCSQHSCRGVASAIHVDAIRDDHLVWIATIECGSVADCGLGRARQIAQAMAAECLALEELSCQDVVLKIRQRVQN